eukprot:jgi/Galph1/2334/GphlegSOOS_G989.1
MQDEKLRTESSSTPRKEHNWSCTDASSSLCQDPGGEATCFDINLEEGLNVDKTGKSMSYIQDDASIASSPEKCHGKNGSQGAWQLEDWREFQQYGLTSSFLVDTQYFQVCRNSTVDVTNFSHSIDGMEMVDSCSYTDKKDSSNLLACFSDLAFVPNFNVYNEPCLAGTRPFEEKDTFSSRGNAFHSYFQPNWNHIENELHDTSLLPNVSSFSTKSVTSSTDANVGVAVEEQPPLSTEEIQSYKSLSGPMKAPRLEQQLRPVAPRIQVEDILLHDEFNKFRSFRNNSSLKRRMDENLYTDASTEQTDEQTANKERRSIKKRLVWTPELHDRFLKAVSSVGINNAVPKTILYLMNVEGLTTEHVKSHLQKYRNNLKKTTSIPKSFTNIPRHSEVGSDNLDDRKVRNAYSSTANIEESQVVSEAQSNARDIIKNGMSIGHHSLVPFDNFFEENISFSHTNDLLFDGRMELELQIQGVVHLLVTARHRVAELSLSLEQWMPYYSSSHECVRILKEQTSLFQQNEMQLLQIQRDFERQQRELKKLERTNLLSPGRE